MAKKKKIAYLHTRGDLIIFTLPSQQKLHVQDIVSSGKEVSCAFSSFIDSLSCDTVAAGCIWKENLGSSMLKDAQKNKYYNAPVLWLTGLSGSGKSTLAREVHKILNEKNVKCEILDGDILRTTICKDLGFSKEDRTKNIERAAHVAQILSQNGVITLCSLISPYEFQRYRAKEIIKNFIEVYINCPLDICEKRDVKGLYKKARANEILDFTGIHEAYEPPIRPDIVVDTHRNSLEKCANQIIRYLIDIRNL